MPTTWRALFVVAAVLLALVIIAPLGDIRAAQQVERASAAGMIVDTGEGDPTYVVVTFDETSVNAVDMLRTADLDAVTVEFGGLGEAVCSIVDTGCDVSTCRQRMCQTGDPESPFWQFWEQDDQGEWSLSALGGSHAEIENGEIAAWVWTGVDPELEPIVWENLAERAGAPDDVARGEIASAPAVYASTTVHDDGGLVNRTGTVTAVGIVAAIGIVAGWLIIRNRRMSRVVE